eukprot:PhF_6_TR30548/c0_g1_i1/m.44838
MSNISQTDIQQLLIEGGYYRARLSNLTPFDLVAGGLSWCILNSHYNIDVDFIEEANIGHKIKVAENICNALKHDMSCPHDLRPHQIQGLDFPKLYPVLQWLLVRVQAAREAYANILKNYVKLDFERRFGVALETPAVRTKLQPHSQAPRRQLRGGNTHKNQLEHINCVLLEYGHRYNTGVSQAAVVEGEPLDEDLRRQQEEEKRDQVAMENIMASMSTFKEKQKVSGSVVGGLMSQGAEAIAAERAAFEERMKELESRRLDVSAQKSRLEQLEGEVVSKTALVDALRASVAAYETDVLTPALKDISKKQRRNNKMDDEMKASWEEINASPEKAENAQTILRLLQERDTAKQELESTQESNTNALDALKQEAAELQQRVEEIALVGSALDDQTAALRTQHTSLQSQYAAVNKELSDAMRLLDSNPTKAEVLQYERRFQELVAEVAWKYDETKQCFSRYNTLSEKAATMKKEITLLHSVKENFETMMYSPTTKQTKGQQDELIGNMDNVVTTIADATSRQKNKLQTEKEELEKAQSTYNQLLAKQRSYYSALKALKDAVAKNDELQQSGTGGKVSADQL